MLGKENSSALLTISDAVRGLVNSLELFQDVTIKLELETATDQSNLSFLGAVVGTLKEMVGKWVSRDRCKT